ncbi:MAG: tRNA preQ1(34) S-adenosylmethionine ribosyltransferase-isomerase QueA [Actinomycetota bacterium]
MHLSDIDYELPGELIAQHPVEPRDSARLFDATSAFVHRRVSDLSALVGEGDLLVVNETRVLPARLDLVRSTGGRVEVLLLEALDEIDARWEALVRPGRKMRDGEELLAADGSAFAVVEGRSEAGDTFVVRIARGDDPASRRAAISAVGSMPLPPYITAPLADRERYQTVYARREASAAAPTAGLHFTPELMARIVDRGARFAPVELVVGLDTFKPVEEENPLHHKIHTERYSVPESTWQAVREARRVIAIGTTSCRALESAATTGRLEGRTDLFITPGYEWKAVDLLMTNFHMPRTTLLLMIGAFVGDAWRDIYAEAVREKYRFLSFGDAMLLARSGS